MRSRQPHRWGQKTAEVMTDVHTRKGGFGVSFIVDRKGEGGGSKGEIIIVTLFINDNPELKGRGRCPADPGRKCGKVISKAIHRFMG